MAGGSGKSCSRGWGGGGNLSGLESATDVGSGDADRRSGGGLGLRDGGVEHKVVDGMLPS